MWSIKHSIVTAEKTRMFMEELISNVSVTSTVSSNSIRNGTSVFCPVKLKAFVAHFENIIVLNGINMVNLPLRTPCVYQRQL